MVTSRSSYFAVLRTSAIMRPPQLVLSDHGGGCALRVGADVCLAQTGQCLVAAPQPAPVASARRVQASACCTREGPSRQTQNWPLRNRVLRHALAPTFGGVRPPEGLSLSTPLR